jgi:hypothetical protein
MQPLKVPTIEAATQLMSEAEKRNPGLWVKHSFFTAQAAANIASVHPALDPSVAYILGYLHDIGRREGVTSNRHIIDGYFYLLKMGYDDAARICLTHPFALKNIDVISGKWDCSQEEFEFVREYLSKIEFNVYDRLIQLCDAVSLPGGFCLMEKRMVDVAIRYGVNPYTVEKSKAYFEIQKEFEQVIGDSIYKLLPGVVNNTFGFFPASP